MFGKKIRRTRLLEKPKAQRGKVMRTSITKLFLAVSIVFASVATYSAQTTEFTYQGRLLDGSLPANASYDLEFRLFNSEISGAPIGTVSRPAVMVNTGIFTVKLDFGPVFDGSPRWIEIAVKPAGSAGPFTLLSPRQSISSAPYAVRSLTSSTADTSGNTLQLGGVPANQYVITTDTRLSDARDPLPSSPNYINNTTSPQTAANFNVSGSGVVGGTLTANAITSTTQFNIGINRALALGTASVFAGRLAGGSNISGSGNSFFGDSAGRFNTSGSNNSFFGRDSGLNNAGGDNSFFGAFTGVATTSGIENSFFGMQAGQNNTTGNRNSFFGRMAGASNTEGNSNSFFGNEAGMSSILAVGSSFFGSRAGRLNTASLNSFFGFESGASNTTAERNSFFGYSAGALNTGANNSFFGSLAGRSNTTGLGNTFMGESAGEANTTGSRNTFIGRWSGQGNTTGERNVFVGFNSGLLNTTGTGNVFVGQFAGAFDNGDNLTLIGSNSGVPNGLTLQYATAIGADAEVSTSNTVQLGRANGFDSVFVPGLIRLNGLGTSGSTDVCRNASNLLSTCSSSLRYKTDIRTFLSGLDVVRRLRPISFRWKDDGVADIGFGAEEVDSVDPLLATKNSSGEIEGVKYKQITTVLVNAVNEQQRIIEDQQKRIDGLTSLVCASHPDAELCSEKGRRP